MATSEKLRDNIAGTILDTEELHDEQGEKMHTANLQLLTKYLHRPGLWRIRLSNVCDVSEVVGGASGGPPRPGEFSLRVTADGELPRSGTLTRLTKTQANYAVHLINDLHKVSRAKDLAREHELAAAGGSLAGQGNRHVAEMMAKVGALPVSKVEKQEEDRRKQKAEEALRLKAKADAEAEVEESIGGLSLEAEMRQAQKKAEKKARQKARKKLEKEAAAARAAASGEAQQTEPEGEAPVLLS
jgi:hypothetical protein